MNGECHEPFHPRGSGMPLGWNKTQPIYYIQNGLTYFSWSIERIDVSLGGAFLGGERTQPESMLCPPGYHCKRPSRCFSVALALVILTFWPL